jgi:hypothetical protein
MLLDMSDAMVAGVNIASLAPTNGQGGCRGISVLPFCTLDPKPSFDGMKPLFIQSNARVLLVIRHLLNPRVVPLYFTTSKRLELESYISLGANTRDAITPQEPDNPPNSVPDRMKAVEANGMRTRFWYSSEEFWRVLLPLLLLCPSDVYPQLPW